MSDGTTYYRGGDVYMAKAPGDVSDFAGNGNVISFAAGHEGVPGVTFTLPNNLPTGQYLVRMEAIALPVASSCGGAPVFMSCSQIDVTNGGSGSPGPLVAIPGSHTGYEPDILINLDYPVPKNYTQPGPPTSPSKHIDPSSLQGGSMAHTSTPGESMPTSAPLDSASASSALALSIYVPTSPERRGSSAHLATLDGSAETSAPVCSGPAPSTNTPSAPAAAERIFSPEDARSAELWYSNGKVIVKVEGMYFKLFHSRLERHCEYSKHMFEDGEATVFDVQDIMLQDFEKLLNYLEISGYVSEPL
ncbi:glycosyl hydrolase family 61-domain-containing protein [Cerioporus squamosus]|nr:glycosyl hydrolase family 61-domain-containing protein [Cerioporus squamosus]